MASCMKVFLNSIGCRLNQSEIETIARQLLANGHEIVSDPAIADKVVINTCAVTREAAKDARKMTRRTYRVNPAAEILLTGCYVTIAPEELTLLDGVDQIIPNIDKQNIISILDPEAKPSAPLYEQEPVLREFLTSQSGNTRAFVKVQDGCNNRCTFCVTTIARGSSQSRQAGDVIHEIQDLTAAGYQEIVLTGVHLGSFGKDLADGSNLYQLISDILYHTDIPRIRLSSLEPWDIPANFFDLWQNKRLLPHLHVPLQSGSDQILRRMARRTSQASFRNLVTDARSAITDLNISTDLIVGFPGESEGEFQESLSFVEEMKFARLHVFPFSRRPGTVAATMSDQVSKAIKKARVRQMIDLGQKLSLNFHAQYENHEVKVLWESTAGADRRGIRWVGYSGNYIRVTACGPTDLSNTITSAYLSEPRIDGMTGQIVLNGDEI